MSGLYAMLKKEALEVRHTSRKWVLLAILLFCAVVAPVVTHYLPLIINDEVMDDPTVVDACAQFLSFLSQIALIGVIIATAGIVSSEVRSGAAMLVLTKPVSRSAFILAKITSQSAILVAATLVAIGVFAGLSYALLGGVPVGDLLTGVGLWLILGLFYTVVMVLISSRVNSQTAAAGIGLGIYALVNVLSLWKPLDENSPAGVVRVAGSLLRGDDVAWLWPTLTTVVLLAALVAISGRVFARREI